MAPMKILIADKFEQVGLDRLGELGCDVTSEPGLSADDLPAALGTHDPDVLIVRSTKVTADALGSANRLSLVIRAGAGYDTIDVATASRDGVFVANCPGKNAIAVAELAWALILTCDRRVPDQTRDLRSGSWNKKACLARLAADVTSIDIYDDFLEAAAEKLAACGINNVELLNVNAMHELPEGGFDAIAVTGSIQSFDPRFVEALNPDGRLFVVVGDAPAMQAKLVERTDENNWQTVSLFETTLAPLVNGALPPQFSF